MILLEISSRYVFGFAHTHEGGGVGGGWGGGDFGGGFWIGVVGCRH